jgi:DNA-binding SARP family transcriptional activator
MLRLGTFGGLVLHDPAGEAVVPQRRRLALLALLAVAGSRGLSRDKVLACLWSESSSDNARHALEQLLYSMRKQVSHPLIAGVDPLRLNPATVTADVTEFDRAIAAGDRAGAVALYRGPFLDGFYLVGAPEFERWVEQERARLEADHAQALRKMAGEARDLGRQTVEIDLWRRVVSTDPLGERGIVGLLRALVEAGDWAGAVWYAREYEGRMRVELPGAPVPDVLALAGGLRSREERRSSGATVRPAEEADR